MILKLCQNDNKNIPKLYIKIFKIMTKWYKNYPKMILKLVGRSCGVLVVLGSIWEAFWEHLGSILEAFWSILGALGEVLGALGEGKGRDWVGFWTWRIHKIAFSLSKTLFRYTYFLIYILSSKNAPKMLPKCFQNRPQIDQRNRLTISSSC